MSTNPQQLNPKTPPQPKAPERGSIPRDSEIETIKRTLYNAIDKLEKLKSERK